MNAVSGEIKKALKGLVIGDEAVNHFVEFLDAMASALNGDIVMEIVPATTTDRVPTALGFSRDVVVTFKDSNGNVMEWLTETFSAKVTVGDTSTAGTASLSTGADLAVVNGVATVTLVGDAAAWLDTETNTVTIANCTPQALAKAVTGGTSIETITA